MIIKVLVFLGILDTVYLLYEHFAQVVPPCYVSSIIDCGEVLRSSYSQILGIPISFFGLIYYLMFLVIKDKYKFILSIFGLLISVLLFFIQIFIIHKICLYCTFSGIINLFLFKISLLAYLREQSRQNKIN